MTVDVSKLLLSTAPADVWKSRGFLCCLENANSSCETSMCMLCFKQELLQSVVQFSFPVSESFARYFMYKLLTLLYHVNLFA